MNSKPEYLKFQKAAIRKKTPLHIWNPQEKVIPNKKMKGQKKHSKKELFSELEDDEDPLSIYDSNSMDDDDDFEAT